MLALTQDWDLEACRTNGKRLWEEAWGSQTWAGWYPRSSHPHSRSSFLPSQDQERRTPLHAAAYVGDVPILQLLLMSGESGELEGVAAREGT